MRSSGLAVLGVRNRPTLPGDQTARPWFPNLSISILYGPHPLGPKRWCMHDGFDSGLTAQPKVSMGECGYGMGMAERYTRTVTGWDGGALGSDQRGKKEG